MKLRRLFRIRRSQKYPIKRDKEGLSLRERCLSCLSKVKDRLLLRKN
jgi:hypothetical protein